MLIFGKRLVCSCDLNLPFQVGCKLDGFFFSRDFFIVVAKYFFFQFAFPPASFTPVFIPLNY
jgi:hypothetical protein